MSKWECDACAYLYDPEQGDKENDIDPGTPFEEIHDEWVCPECGAGKEYFRKVSI